LEIQGGCTIGVGGAVVVGASANNTGGSTVANSHTIDFNSGYFDKGQGNQEVRGSRDAIREALKVGLIDDGELWMETIKARNLTSHTYSEELAENAFTSISNEYIPIFMKLLELFEKLKSKELGL
jgi:hypothetical protein